MLLFISYKLKNLILSLIIHNINSLSHKTFDYNSLTLSLPGQKFLHSTGGGAENAPSILASRALQNRPISKIPSLGAWWVNGDSGYVRESPGVPGEMPAFGRRKWPILEAKIRVLIGLICRIFCVDREGLFFFKHHAKFETILFITSVNFQHFL